MSSDVKTLASAISAAWNRQVADEAVAFYHPDYEGRDISAGASFRGREGVRQWLSGYWTAYPDLRFTVRDAIQDGDRLAFHWEASATAPDGVVHFEGMSFLTLRDGLVARGEYLFQARPQSLHARRVGA